MTAIEMEKLSDEELIKISLERNKKNKNYTSDALRAQKVYQNRKGGFRKTYIENEGYICKRDMSYYSDRYY